MCVLNDWLRSRDVRLARADAVYAPSYCLAEKEDRMTDINERCTKKAINQIRGGQVSHLILSCAYPGFGYEEFIHKEIMLFNLLSSGVLKPEQIYFLEEVKNSIDEAEKLAEILRQIDAHALIVVAEEWHLPRVLYALRRTNPRVCLSPLAVRAAYEPSREPSRIKRWRAAHKVLWIAWNIAGYLVTPFLVRKRISDVAE